MVEAAHGRYVPQLNRDGGIALIKICRNGVCMTRRGKTLPSTYRAHRVSVNDCGKESMPSKGVSSGNPFVVIGICAKVLAMYLS